jgi:hypothetical protein
MGRFSVRAAFADATFVCFGGSAPSDVRRKTAVRLKNATNNIVLKGIADPGPLNVTQYRAFRND